MMSCFYQWYVDFGKIMLHYQGVFLEKRRTGDHEVLQYLNLSHLYDVRLYSVSIKKMHVLVRGASSSLRNRAETACFNISTLFTSTMAFSEESKTVIAEYRTDSSRKVVEVLRSAKYHASMTSAHYLVMLFSCTSLQINYARHRKETWKGPDIII